MKIKDFEEKYNINFDGAFVYDGLLRMSKKFNELPTRYVAKVGELDRVDFTNDFLDLEP